MSHMNSARIFAGVALALAASGLAGCGGAVEGKYTLDKAAVKKAMQAEIAKSTSLPPAMVNALLATIDAMDMSVELQSGGKLKLSATMPNPLEPGKPGVTQDSQGTWTADGDAIVLTADGKALKCSKSRSKLSCASGKTGDPALVFNKS